MIRFHSRVSEKGLTEMIILEHMDNNDGLTPIVVTNSDDPTHSEEEIKWNCETRNR